MRKDSKDLVVHVCGKRGSRHSGGCVGCLKVLSEYTDPMASEEEDCEVGSVRYCREVLKLNNEGYDPRAKEIDRMVPKEEVLRVFGSKTGGKRNLRMENCVDSNGNPDHELIEFATELHKKVYRTCKSKDISLAFGRGVLADRRGARIDWATFASKTQAKQMKMAASWAERHPGEVVSGRDASGKDTSGNVAREETKGQREEEVSSCDKEVIAPAVCAVVSMDVERVPAVEEQMNWQQHHATSDTERMIEDGREDTDKPQVADDDIWENNRVEEIEEQLKRVDMQRKQWQEEYIKVLQSSLHSLQSDRSVAEREMQDVTVKLKEGRGKIAEVQKRILTVKENLEQNKLERTKHEDRLQSLVWDKRRLSRPNSKPPNLSELNAERELVQELLQGTYEQAGILEQLMARHAQMETILRQRVGELDAHLADVVRNFQEKDSRVEKESKKLQEAFQVMLHFQSVYNLIKQSDNLVIVPRCIPQPREYPQELNPPQTITIKPCPVCSRWFYCGDWVGASCGCVYHLHCAAMWFRQSNKCCKPGCAKNMHPDWLTAWGKQWDDEALLTNLEKNLDEWRNRWKDDYKRQGRKRSRNDAFSSFDLSLEIGGSFEGARLGLNTIEEPELHELDPKRIRASEDSSVTCNQCMQDFVIEDVPGEPCQESLKQEDQDNPVKHGDLTLNLLESLEEGGPAIGHIPGRIDGLEHGDELLVSSQDASEQDGERHNGLREMSVSRQSSEKQGQDEDIDTQSSQDIAGRNALKSAGESSAESSEEDLEIDSPKQVTSQEGREIQCDVKDMPVTPESIDEDMQRGHVDNRGMHNSKVQDASDLVNETRPQTVQQVEEGKALNSQIAAVEDTGHPSCVKEMTVTSRSEDMDSDVGDVNDTDVQDFIVDDVCKLVGESEYEGFDERKGAPPQQGKFEEEAQLQNEVTVNRQIVGREGELEYVENAIMPHFGDDGLAFVGEVGPKVLEPEEEGSAPRDTVAGDENRALQPAVDQVLASEQSQGVDSEVKDTGDAVIQDSVDDVVESASPRHQSLGLEDQEYTVSGQSLLESEKGHHIGSVQVARTQLTVERERKAGDGGDGELSIESESEVRNVCDTAMQDVAVENQALGLEVPSIPASLSNKELQCAAEPVGEPQQRTEKENLGEDADREMFCMQTESQVKDGSDTAMHDSVIENQALGLEVLCISSSVSDKELQSAAQQMGETQQPIERKSSGENDDNEVACIQTESQVKDVTHTATQDLVVENQDLGLEVLSISAAVSDKGLQSAPKRVGEPLQPTERESSGEDADNEMPYMQAESQVADLTDTAMQDFVADDGPDFVTESKHQEFKDQEAAAPILVLTASGTELHTLPEQVAGAQQTVETENKVGGADDGGQSSETEGRVRSSVGTAMHDFVAHDIQDDALSHEEMELDDMRNAATSHGPAKADNEPQNGAEQLGMGSSSDERTNTLEEANGGEPCLERECEIGVADTDVSVLKSVEEPGPLMPEEEYQGSAAPAQTLSEADAELQNSVMQLAEKGHSSGLDIKVGSTDDGILCQPPESVPEDVDHASTQDLVVRDENESDDLMETDVEPGSVGHLEEIQQCIEHDVVMEDLESQAGVKLLGHQPLETDENGAKHDGITKSLHERVDAAGPATPPVSESTEDILTHNAQRQVPSEQDTSENKVDDVDIVDNAGIHNFFVQDFSNLLGEQSRQTEEGQKTLVETAAMEETWDGTSVQVGSMEGAELQVGVEESGERSHAAEQESERVVIGKAIVGGDAAIVDSEAVANKESLAREVISVSNDAVHVSFDAGGSSGGAEAVDNDMYPVEHVFDAGDNNIAPHSLIPAVVTAEGRVDNVAADKDPPTNAGGHSGEAEVDADDNSIAPHSSIPAVETAEERVDNVAVDDSQLIGAGRHSEAEVFATEPCSTRNDERVDHVPVVEVATGHRAWTGFTPGAVIELLSDDDDDDVIEVPAPTQFVSRRNRVPERAVQQSTPSEAGVGTAAQPGTFTALLRAVEQHPQRR